MSTRAVQALLDAYPRIYFACHRRHVRDPADGRALSAHQASILDHLDAVEPTSLHALATHMGVTASTMSLAVDRLELAGYVIRVRDVNDRRRLELRLTEAGVRIKSANSVLDPSLVATLLAEMTPANRRAAIRGLKLLADAADATMQKSARTKRGFGRRIPPRRRSA
jgi:DNA-binding MarR family transcriptional regulator